MTNTQFEAEIGGRAGFRKNLDETARRLVEDGLIEDDTAAWADFSDERLAYNLIGVLIDVTIDQEDRLEIAGRVMRNVRKAVKLIKSDVLKNPEAEAGDDAERILKEIREETEELRRLAKAGSRRRPCPSARARS